MAAKNNPRIAFLKYHLGGKEGGLEKQTRMLAHAFAEQGAKITLLTSSAVSSPSFETVTFRKRGFFGFSKLLSYDKACRAYLQKNPFDLVFGLDRNSFQTHLRAGNGVHAVYLKRRVQHEGFFKRISFAINPLHRTLLHLEKTGFENPALQVLLTNSFMVRHEILDYYNVDESKIHTLHNGMEWQEKEPSFFEGFERKRHLFSTFGLPSERFHFLFIGNDFRRKGLLYVLKALAHLPKDSYFLSIVGKDRKQSEFEAICQKLLIQDNVRFFGLQADTTPFYQIADTLVIPSLYDPFANVTLEALAMGLTIITSPYNGGKEVLTENSGFVLSELSEEALHDAMSQAMKTPKEKNKALQIRHSVQSLDFSLQLPKVVALCLK